MRWCLLVGLALAAWTGAIGFAEKVVTPEELEQAMKIIGSSLDVGAKAITTSAYGDAKAPLVLARQTLASTIPFWGDRKIDNAAKLTRDAVRKLDDIDAALSAMPVDAAAVASAVKAVNDACAACHTIYREGDRQTGYRIKAGILNP